jgi:hypothetical protein
MIESNISEFHTALGQFMNYRMVLEEEQPKRTLYLAVPLSIFESFFALPFGQMAIERHQLKLIVYDAKNEVIIKWLN